MTTTVSHIGNKRHCIRFTTRLPTSEKTGPVLSQETFIDNLRWCICVERIDNNLFFFLVSGACNNHYTASVQLTRRLLRNDSTVFYENTCARDMRLGRCAGGKPFAISKVPKNCVNSNGDITVECEFEVKEASGNYGVRWIDFAKRSELSNTTLMVGDATFYANDGVLKCASPVFAKMLDIDKTIQLKDIDPKDFGQYLNILYQSDVSITYHTVGRLLMYAEKFKTPQVTELCELYLLANRPSRFLGIEVKKVYAEKYGLKDLAKKYRKTEKHGLIYKLTSSISGLFLK